LDILFFLNLKPISFCPHLAFKSVTTKHLSKTQQPMNILKCILLSLTSCLALGVTASANTERALPAPTDGDGQKLVHISSLNSVEANQEFQQNVRVVQAQRQGLIDLLNQINETTDSAEVATLEAQRDELLASLNRNNQTMLETYGFTLNRNYVMVVEKSHIFLAVSEEEAEQIQATMDAENAAE